MHLKRDTWDEAQPLEPWVRAIARYKLADHLRRRGFHDHVDIDDYADSLAVAVEVDAAATVDSRQMLAGLPERQRRIVEEISLEGRRAAEVATAPRHERRRRARGPSPRAEGAGRRLSKRPAMKTENLVEALVADRATGGKPTRKRSCRALAAGRSGVARAVPHRTRRAGRHQGSTRDLAFRSQGRHGRWWRWCRPSASASRCRGRSRPAVRGGGCCRWRRWPSWRSRSNSPSARALHGPPGWSAATP